MKIKKFLFNNWKKILFFIFVCISFFLTDKYIVKADTYYYTDFTAKLYDNYGPTLSAVTTNETNNRYQGVIPTMAANSSGGAWGISSPITILANRTYTLTVTIDGTYGGNIVLSSYNRIGVGSSLSNAVTSYQNNSNVTENYSRALNDGMTLQYAFTPTVNGSYIVFPFATSSSGNNWTFYIESVIIEDLGTNGITQNEINNSLNNQTEIINDTIIENNENTQNSIANNNGASDAITDSLNTCGNLYKYTLKKGKKFDPYGNLIDDSNSYYTPDYYYIMSATKLTFKGFGVEDAGYIILYDSDYNYLDYWRLTDREIDLGNLNPTYYRISTKVPSGLMYEGTCTNKIDQTNEKLDQTNEQLGDLNDNLTNSDSSDATNEAGNFFSGFETDTFGLTSIITAPLDLIGSITSSSCSPLSLTIPYVNKPFNLPCMTTIYEKHFGSFLDIYQTITFGIVAYWVCVRIFALVKDFKNPDHDEIEVLDL